MPPFLQTLCPQHLLSRLMGWFASSKMLWVKNFFIKQFMRHYHVILKEAVIENPEAYPTFNDFFTRALKPNARPVHPNPRTLISPAEGIVTQIGNIQRGQLLQAKQFYFSLDNLLSSHCMHRATFEDGKAITIYLAPHNYHRVHMPLEGRLVQTIYIPGKLFSVNQKTASTIPNLFSRNERLIAVFETAIGPVCIVLVGAMIVGNIQTVWMKTPIHSKTILVGTESIHSLAKGAELGRFQLGSTVIALFANKTLVWQPNLITQSAILVNQTIATF